KSRMDRPAGRWRVRRPGARSRRRPRRSRPARRSARARGTFDRPRPGLVSPASRPAMPASPNSFRTRPDERGHFGIFGGRYVAETLMPLILELEKAYNEAKADPAFQAELSGLLTHYAGRPSPLYLAKRLTEHLGGAKVYLKRDELNHTGSHKINN